MFSRRKNDSAPVEITVSNRTVIRVILIIVATTFTLNFINRAGHVLVLIGVSAFLALALNPAVSRLTRSMKSGSRVRATGLAYIVVLVILSSFIWLVVPPLVRQTSDFVKEVPTIVSDFKTQDSALARTFRRYNLDVQLDKFSDEFASKFNVTGTLFSTAGKVGATLVSIITVLVLTFMMLIEGPRWLSFLWRFHPDGPNEEHRKRMARRMYKVVTAYVNGQVLIAAIAATFALVVVLIVSTLLNVSVNALALAAIVFLFGMIPMFGNTIGAALVVLICLFSSTTLALIMGGYFIVYQQIENVTLQPYIQSKTNELTPLLVFIAALLGVGFGGVLGAFVAIPLAGCLRIVIEDYMSTRGYLNSSN